MGNIEKLVRQERWRIAYRANVWIIGLLLTISALTQGGLAFYFMRHPVPPVRASELWAAVLFLTLLGLGALGWRWYATWKVSDRAAAVGVDQRLAASKNRVETVREFGQLSDSIFQAQKEETTEYLSSVVIPPNHSSFLLGSMLLWLVSILLINGVLVGHFAGLLSQALTSLKKPPMVVRAKPVVRPDFARVDIVTPETEIKATQVEEIQIKAKADSDHGFSEMTLEASINGGPVHPLPINGDLFLKGGETPFAQSMLMDELKVEPFDVVAYYIEGKSRHVQPLLVSSQEQFIQIRPFREDVLKPNDSKKKQWSAKGEQEVATLMELISSQIFVAKETWVVASDLTPVNDPQMVKARGQALDAQQQLIKKTQDLYQNAMDDPDATMDPETAEHVRLASVAMNEAVMFMRLPALREANVPQQKALGQLVAATKGFVKMFGLPKGSKPPPPDAFKDPQKYRPEKTKNKFDQLEDLVREEDQVMKDLAKTAADALPGSAGDPEKVAAKQSEIARDLGDLKRGADFSSPAHPQLDLAENSLQDSQDKLSAHDVQGGMAGAKEAKAAMLRVLDLWKEEEAKNLRDELAAAQQKLDGAAKEEKGASNPDEQKDVKAKVGAAKDQLTAEQNRQEKEGDPNLAKDVGALVKKMEEAKLDQQLSDLAEPNGGSPQTQKDLADKLQALADSLSAERLAMQSEQENLQDTLKRIDRVKDNLAGMKDKPDSPEKSAMAAELGSDLDTAVTDAKALLPGRHPAADGVARSLVGKVPTEKSDQVPIDAQAMTYQPSLTLLAAFRQEVADRLLALQNQEVLSYLNPDQAPEDYRELVSAYYERISKETKAAP